MMAQDGLAVALGMYVKSRQEIPVPSGVAPSQVLVAVPPIVAAKLALYSAMRSQGITNVALAAQMGLERGRDPQTGQPRPSLAHQPGRECPLCGWAHADC